MKKIKIKFVDFWNGFDIYDNIFVDCIKKKYDIEFSDNPDYIIYSVFGNEYLNYNCVRIFYTGENIRPDFNLCDYALGFDYIDFEDRYMRLPLYLFNHYRKDLDNAINKHNLDKDKVLGKKLFCNFVYSNGNADKKRTEFFNMLNEYKKVDSGGKYLNNIGGPIEDKFAFQKKYKFSIAFENSSTSGYTTEKLIQAVAAGTIPIYWGNPNIYKEFNTKSFINCHEYDTFYDVIEKVKEIDNNDELFFKIIKEPFVEEYIIKDYFEKLQKFFDNIFSKENASKRLDILHGKNYENRVRLGSMSIKDQVLIKLKIKKF